MKPEKTTEYITEILKDYKAMWLDPSSPHSRNFRDEEHDTLQAFHTFLSNSSYSWFERSCRHGHFTGSALVTTPELNKVLLTHHRKLNLWLQLGGHADGEHQLDRVASQEAHEESGLTRLYIDDCKELSQQNRIIGCAYPFDLDRHLIPARLDEPAHFHYDVRYLVIADPIETLTISQESHDLGWFSLEKAYQLTTERSMHRQFEKLELVANLRGCHS